MKERPTQPKPIVLQVPLRAGSYMAQVVLPRDLTKAEADRMCRFVQSLAAPTTHH